ncbi:MAG: Wzz/FepE/Etk N-terminal domain-containing protein [Candidatus Fermentibacteria bacterium]
MTEKRRPLWYLFLMLKNRWFLVKALLIIMIPTIIVTYLMKKKYTVISMVMPPEDQSASGLSIAGLGLSEFAGYFSGGMGFSLPLMTTMSDVFEEILKSRSLIEHVILSTAFIDSTDLRSVYDQDNDLGLYWARLKFEENYSASVTPSGFLKIQFTAGDPLYAVEVSESIIMTLDSINSEIEISRLKQTTAFLELRWANADSLLSLSILNLQNFEQEHGIINPDQELLAFIENITELKRQYIVLLTDATAIRAGISGGYSSSALLMERQAQELLEVIKMLESGNPSEGYEDILTSLSPGEYSTIQYEYAGLRADYEMALRLAAGAEMSLQQAIVAEGREQQSIRVLDPPRHPGWKSKPKRSLIWLEVFALAFISLFGFLIARENIRNSQKRSPEEWEPWRRLFEEIRREFSFRRK